MNDNWHVGQKVVVLYGWDQAEEDTIKSVGKFHIRLTNSETKFRRSTGKAVSESHFAPWIEPWNERTEAQLRRIQVKMAIKNLSMCTSRAMDNADKVLPHLLAIEAVLRERDKELEVVDDVS